MKISCMNTINVMFAMLSLFGDSDLNVSLVVIVIYVKIVSIPDLKN